ncbi:peptidoglycan DD-metalloendopeptidase family protein [Candidatus Peregrinibacteria bacterium]|jgi:hypothetical protein|nr:peptidoglycan DD-metalloendopeptidase family protein [Candidatus Peregrinibacteria bacterium]
MAKKKNQKQGFKKQWILFVNKHRPALISSAFVVLVAILSTMGQSTWFKSSLLEVSHPFNGTIYPIAKSPDYTKWPGNVKVDRYESIEEKYLAALPDYNDALKEMSATELDKNPKVKNAKLTFPVVYLGNYHNDHEEDSGSHLAVDIRVPVGTPVQNIANGVVTKAQLSSSGFGNHMCVKHSAAPDPDNAETQGSFYSCYNHMDALYVEQGEFIMKGEIVGTSGNTGTSTTPHLHFQIDRDNAPWHPYWPFSWAEASAASLSFFEAVSAGLNKDKARQMTINPLTWISSNYSEDGLGSVVTASATNNTADTEVLSASSDATENNSNDSNAEPVLSSFEITTDQTQFNTEEQTSLTITAKDQFGNTLKDFKPSSDLIVQSSSGSADFKKVLRFLNGKAKLSVSNTVVESFDITIEQSGVKGDIALNSQEVPEELHASADDENQDNNNEASSDDSSESSENNNQPEETVQKVQVVISGDNYVIAGNPAVIHVELKDENGNAITELKKDINIEVSGKGSLSKNTISAGIVDDKILVNYNSNEEEEAVITIQDQSLSITIASEVKEPSAFRVYTEGDVFLSGSETDLIIQAVDVEGKDTPKYSALGTVSLTIEEGQGTISPNEINSDNFREGKAVVTLSVNEGEKKIKVKAHNGAFIGSSSIIRPKAVDETIFTDVESDHKNAEAIAYLKENEIIGGYDDGSFKPDNEVSRIEALKMLLLALNKGLDPADLVNFPDTESGAWYSPYVGRALNLKMVKGYPDGSFKPANKVNRAEYYKILISAAGIEVPKASFDPFEDVPVGTWFSDPVAYAKEKEITDAQNKFHPEESVTRAEVAETLYRIIQLKNR